MPLPRRRAIALLCSSVLVAVPASAVLALALMDWNDARPWLAKRIGAALGRPLTIAGQLQVQWRQPAGGTARHGWHAALPWPHLVAHDVRMGNPDGIGQPLQASASARQLSFALDPLALPGKTVVIPELRFEQPVLHLLRSADGSNNWTFVSQHPDSPWRVDIQGVAFGKGTVYFSEIGGKAQVRARVDTLAGDRRYGVAWHLDGSYNGEAVTGSGKAGSVLTLRHGQPFPLLADVRVGATRLTADGVLQPARQEQRQDQDQRPVFDLRLSVSGPSMASLYGLTGVLLPETPPFSAEGQLRGTPARGGGQWLYQRFSGKVGSSDISGSVNYTSGKPHNSLSGTVHSRLLQVRDLGPLIGAGQQTQQAQQKQQSGKRRAAGRVLPDKTFNTENWRSLHADVRYTAERITRDARLPISEVDTHIVLKDGVLALAPLNFRIAGGTLKSQLRLDGSGKAGNKVAGELQASARRLKVSELFPRVAALKSSKGVMHGEAKLAATGNSVASLLGQSNGEVSALVQHGSISKVLLEEMGLNLGSVIVASLAGDQQVRLNCMAADFAVKKGLMQTRKFVIDTDEAVIDVSGQINLASESLALRLQPDSKGWRLFSLRSPLQVHGSFSHPQVSVDKSGVALRAGSALALAGVAPFAAMLPLVEGGTVEDRGCAMLQGELREKNRLAVPRR